MRLNRKVKRQVRADWGNKCSSFDPGCMVCVAWKIAQATGKAPTEDDDDKIPYLPNINMKKLTELNK